MNFEQEYIPHEYVELRMSAGADSGGAPAFKMDPNHLHIWPRHSFMLIALPNKVGSSPILLLAPFRYLLLWGCPAFRALPHLRRAVFELPCMGSHALGILFAG